MVGLGLLMMRLGLWSLWLRWRGGLYDSALAACGAAVLMGPAGFVAVLAGWITTEVGRQPYTVYGLLRTADSRLADRRARRSAPRSLAFIVVYFVVFGAGVFYILRLMAQAAASVDEPDIDRARRCARPASRPRPRSAPAAARQEATP